MFLLSKQSMGQGNSFGTIHGSIGVSAGVVTPVTILHENGMSYTVLAGIGVPLLTSSTPMELNFGLADPLSIGINYRPMKFRYGAVISMEAKSIGFNFNLYLINRKKFSMEMSLTPQKLIFKPVNIDILDNHIDFRLKGSGFSAMTKFNIYFSKNAGIYFGFGYDSYKIGLESFRVDSENTDVENELTNALGSNLRIKTPGIRFSVGIAIKLSKSTD